MEVRCQQCGHVQSFADDLFGNREKVDLTCPACGQTLRVVNPKLATFRLETTRKKLSPLTEELSVEGRTLRLPENQELSLKVLEGEEKGTVYPVAKPRITIGRAHADVIINDRMSSRLHCALEVSDESVLLRDLGSTNGTLVNDQPIQIATLSSGSTFRIGKHVFQLVVTPKGA